jgi:hypothetical protein
MATARFLGSDNDETIEVDPAQLDQGIEGLNKESAKEKESSFSGSPSLSSTTNCCLSPQKRKKQVMPET